MDHHSHHDHRSRRTVPAQWDSVYEYRPRSLIHSSLSRVKRYKQPDLFHSQCVRDGCTRDDVVQSTQHSLYAPRCMQGHKLENTNSGSSNNDKHFCNQRSPHDRPCSALDAMNPELQHIWNQNRLKEASERRLQQQTQQLMAKWSMGIARLDEEIVRRQESLAASTHATRSSASVAVPTNERCSLSAHQQRDEIENLPLPPNESKTKKKNKKGKSKRGKKGSVTSENHKIEVDSSTMIRNAWSIRDSDVDGDVDLVTPTVPVRHAKRASMYKVKNGVVPNTDPVTSDTSALSLVKDMSRAYRSPKSPVSFSLYRPVLANAHRLSSAVAPSKKPSFSQRAAARGRASSAPIVRRLKQLREKQESEQVETSLQWDNNALERGLLPPRVVFNTEHKTQLYPQLWQRALANPVSKGRKPTDKKKKRRKKRKKGRKKNV